MAHSDLDWCFNSWKEFTSLAPEEEELLRMIKKGTIGKFVLSKIREELEFEKERQKWIDRKNAKTIICFETNQKFSCAEHCAKFYNVNKKAVYRALDCTKKDIAYRLKHKYTLSYIGKE